MLYEETKVLRYRLDYSTEDFPLALSNQLGKLNALKKHKLQWSPGAREIFEAAQDRLQSISDDRERVLWGRTPAKIMQIASICTASLLAKTIERSTAEIAEQLVSSSDQMFVRGIDKANQYRVLEHADLRREVMALITDAHRTNAPPPTQAEIKAKYKTNAKHKRALADVFEDIEQNLSATLIDVHTKGRKRKGYVPYEGVGS